MLKTFSLAMGSGLVFGVLSAIIGLIAAPAVGLVDEFVGALPGAFWGFMIGYPIGSIIGLLLVNKLLHYQGSILYGALSIILVSAINYWAPDIIDFLTRGQRVGFPEWMHILFVFLGTPLLGTLGFHKFHEWFKAGWLWLVRVLSSVLQFFTFKRAFWKPTVAGMLMIIAVAQPFLVMWIFTALPNQPEFLGIKLFMFLYPPWVVACLPLLFSSDTDTLAGVIIIFGLLASLAAIVGSFFAHRRKVWGLVLVGSIGALLCSPYFGIPALILILMSKDEFRK